MADLRINPSRLDALLRRYRPDAATRDGVGGTTEFVMNCPFHTDSHASFHINLHKGVGYCFSCPIKKGYTLEETIAKLEGRSARQAASLLRQEGVYEKVAKEEDAPVKESKEDSCGVKPEQLDVWLKELLGNASALAEIVQCTGWTLDTIKQFKIGYNGSSFCIPIMNNGVVTNVKYYRPHGKPKYAGIREHNVPSLWPLENLSKPGVIWLMEGEKDCILANQVGLHAVTFTGGAGNIAMEYLNRFQERDVFIVYDIDQAGKAGARVVADILVRVCSSVKVLEIPVEGLPSNGDFTDFIHKAKHDVTELKQIALMTETYKRSDSKTKVQIADEVINTYLEDIIPKKLFFRRVRMRVRAVSIAQGKTYLVPKETHVNCNRDLGDQCLTCSMNYNNKEPMILRMRPEYPEIMQLVDNDDNRQKAAIKSLLEIYPKCPKLKYEFKEFQAFYPIVLIPALEKDKPNHSYLMQTAWALDVPSETNQDYLAEAVVMTDPDTQAFAIVCYKLDKDMASVDQFELTPEMIEGLRVFQCQLQPTSTTS